MKADILIKNAKCLTMKDGFVADWIAIKGKNILSLGLSGEEDNLIGKNTTLINAQGNTVLPGFIDSHFHVVQTALNAKSMDLNKVKSFDDIGCEIENALLKNPGKSIMGIGLQMDHMEEKTFPDRLVLDKYCKNVPLWINSLDYQVSMLNTYGLLYYKIPFNMDGIEKMPMMLQLEL